MKWSKAIEHIKYGLENNKEVEIWYHRKWNKNDFHCDKVDCISEYEWQGEKQEVINTLYDQVDGGIHIIDLVRWEDK